MANGHGGSRKGAGRPRSRQSYKADPKELQPIDFALEIMRNIRLPMLQRVEALKIVIPYTSARLQATELTVDADLTIELISYLDLENPDSKSESA